MNIAIIGAGFTGMTAGLRLAQQGHDVTIYESLDKPGGLAIGFRDKKWDWPLEKHYHHLFTSDWDIRNLAKEINHSIIFKRPKTSTYFNGDISQIDSPMSLLKFEHLTHVDRMRTGAALAYLKVTPFWKHLESISVEDYAKTTMGKNSWEVLWQPLLVKKFGSYAEVIPASWFWARVKKRSASLGYPKGGFENLSLNLAKTLTKNNIKIEYSSMVQNVSQKGDELILTYVQNSKKHKGEFDKVICTLPSPLFVKMAEFPKKYQKQLTSLKGIGAINLVLSLKEKFLKDNTYWLNINHLGMPFLGIVEHTNFMPAKHYNKEKLVYIGNYLENTNELFTYTEKQLLDLYMPHLKDINKNFKRSMIKNMWAFKAPFAQPIIHKNYSLSIPTFDTPVKNLYLANMQQVYPWDRGTNYAVELGNKIAKVIC